MTSQFEFGRRFGGHDDRSDYFANVDAVKVANDLRDFADAIEAGKIDVLKVQSNETAMSGAAATSTLAFTYVNTR